MAIVKKVVVMSDSHRNDQNVEKVIRQQPHADAYLHCGDFCGDSRVFPEISIVLGNCDYDLSLPRKMITHFEGVGIFMVHGDKIYDRNRTLARWAKENNCQIAVHGHTHSCVDEVVNGIRILNPGSLSMNRDGSPLSYIVIDIDGTDYRVSRVQL